LLPVSFRVSIKAEGRLETHPAPREPVCAATLSGLGQSADLRRCACKAWLSRLRKDGC